MRFVRYAVVILALAGCGDQASGARPARPDRPVVAKARPPKAEKPWVLTERGFGRVRIGMSADETRAALGGALVLDEPIGSDDSDDGCRYGTSPALPGGAALMFEGGRLVRVDADSASTAAGARVGQDEAAVLALYPGARVLPHHYVQGHYLVVIPGAPADTMYRIVFETDGRRVTALRGGIFPQVEYVEGCA